MLTCQTDKNDQEIRLKSSLYLWNGCAMFLWDKTDSTMHQHHAVQIVIGLDRPFRLHLDSESHQSRVAIIAADVPHRIVSRAGWHVVIMLNPELKDTKKLVAKHLTGVRFRLLDISVIASFIPTLRNFIVRTHSGERAKLVCDEITHALTGMKASAEVLDERIQKALNFLDRLPVKKISVKDVAKAIGLSEGRLTHLFKEQVGIPIRRYLLWQRLWIAIEKVVHCGSLTCAAHGADFADSAHLSRTFRRMFGITMSEIFKKRQHVQIIPFF